MAWTVRDVSGALGTEIAGIDLRALDAASAAQLRAVLHDREVVFIRGADLTPEEHLALGRQLGEPAIFPVARLLGATEPGFQVIEDGPDSPPTADEWHTDVTWTAEPPKYAILCAEVVPDRGGDTLWASMTAAYHGLSPVFRELLTGLSVVHDNEAFIAAAAEKMGPSPGTEDLLTRLRATYPPVTHPLVRTHPDTGRRALFLGGGFMRRIEGLHEKESRALLDLLARHIDDARFQCRWRWTPGDVAIWDERSTNHRNAADYFPQHRRVRRIEICGDRPVFHPEPLEAAAR